jgi:outer membrane protein OmpA-like peptidoglycan-associated protein
MGYGAATTAMAPTPVTAPPPAPGAVPGAPPPTPAPSPGPAPAPAPFPGSDATNPLSIFFNFDSPVVVDQTNEGAGTGQFAKLQGFAESARGVSVKALTINGFASPEGDAAHNATLARNRATSVQTLLTPLLSGVAITIGTTAELPGPPSTFPSLRRADVFITART